MNRSKPTTASRIKLLREELGISQAQLAKIRSVSQATVAKQETGERSLGEDGLNWYADQFEVTTDWLLGRTDYRKVPQPTTIAAHETEGMEEVSEARMEEIIKQAYCLIMEKERRKKHKAGDE